MLRSASAAGVAVKLRDEGWLFDWVAAKGQLRRLVALQMVHEDVACAFMSGTSKPTCQSKRQTESTRAWGKVKATESPRARCLRLNKKLQGLQRGPKRQPESFRHIAKCGALQP